MSRSSAYVLGMAAVLAAPALFGGCSTDAPASGDTAASAKVRVVRVDMTDIDFSLKSLRLTRGTVVEFQFRNAGVLVHEAVIGTHEEQVAHEKEMAAMGAMAMPDEANAISVKPKSTKVLHHVFDTTGSFEVGCHTAGHYKAGMKIDVTVI